MYICNFVIIFFPLTSQSLNLISVILSEQMSASLQHGIEIDRKATRVRTFEVCVPTHVTLRMFIRQVLASQLPFLDNRNEHIVL